MSDLPPHAETRCVIFDLDGTLVDSEGLCNQAFLDLIPDLTISLDEMVHRFRGRKLDLIFHGIEKIVDHALPSDFEKPYRARVAELFDSQLKPMPGVHEMLESLDCPICIASSGPMAKIRRSLSVSQLAPFFGSHVFSSYDVGTWKPDPGLFLHAASTMGFASEQCAVVEDSPPGIEAALTANMSPFLYSPHDSSNSFPAGVVQFSDMRNLPALLETPPVNSCRDLS